MGFIYYDILPDSCVHLLLRSFSSFLIYLLLFFFSLPLITSLYSLPLWL